MGFLRDSYGRQFTYLRLSLTEKCNFKCTYCLPNGYKSQSCEPDLNINEIRNLLQGFRALGFSKVRLTGGEPTLRRDIVEIVALAKNTGFETVALTTNGYRLLNLLEPLKRAGLDQINISIDSLDPKKFLMVSGHDCGDQVVLAAQKAAAMGFRKVKVNTVLMKGINDQEFDGFLSWVREFPLSLRFIELMPTYENKEFFHEHHMRSQPWIQSLKPLGWSEIKKAQDAGPAMEFSHPAYRGEVGFITPFQSVFCDNCNRLRVSAKGALRLCLFGTGAASLRKYIQNEQQQENLIDQIEELILVKKSSHSLNQGDSGDTKSFSSIGG